MVELTYDPSGWHLLAVMAAGFLWGFFRPLGHDTAEALLRVWRRRRRG